MTSDLPSASNPPSLARGLLPLIAIVFVGFLCVALPLPALPLFVHGNLKFDTGTVGWVMGAQALATILTRRQAGAFCDRHGPRRAVLVGLPLASLAALLHGAAALIDGPGVSLAVLMAGRLVMGPAESLFLTGCMTWGFARVGAHRAGIVMGWQGIAMFAALGLAGPVGIALYQRIGLTGLALVTVLLPLIALAVVLALPAPQAAVRGQGPGLRLGEVLRMIGRYGLGVALGAMPFAILTGFVVLFYDSRQWAGAGFAIMAFSAGYIGVRLFLAHLPDRIGGLRVGAVSVAIEGVAQLLLWQADSAGAAIAGALLTGIGFSLVYPSMGVEAMARVPTHARGVAVGTFMAFIDVANGLTGPLVGWVVGSFGYPAAFIVGGGACFLSLALMLTAPPRAPINAEAA